MDDFLSSKLGRAAAALFMTLLVLRALYQGETGGKFNVKHEESEAGFGLNIILMSLFAAALWFSLILSSVHFSCSNGAGIRLFSSICSRQPTAVRSVLCGPQLLFCVTDCNTQKYVRISPFEFNWNFWGLKHCVAGFVSS